jgi:hypothetical protein
VNVLVDVYLLCKASRVVAQREKQTLECRDLGGGIRADCQTGLQGGVGSLDFGQSSWKRDQ